MCGICDGRQKIVWTLWFEVGASSEKSYFWELVDVACADCSWLNPGA